MATAKRHPLIAGARITGAGTLASRVTGMVRDMATASLLGMSGGGVMDAFVVAFRIPNLFRRLFGEGALAASFLPVVTAQMERDRKAAWQLVSVMLTWLSVVLVGLVVAAEGVCLAIWVGWGDQPGVSLLMSLTCMMMPYMLFMCLAAQVSATLQAASEFRTPALTPTVLNICWLTAAWFVAPYFADKQAQAHVLAAAILVAGVLQLAVQLPVLWSFGFRYDYNWAAGRTAVGQVVQAMLPMVLGLAITQINTLCDSLIAWGFAASPQDPQRVAWLGGLVRYPMEQGAAAAVYYGERMYEFPLGILGMAVATSIFPLLSRHAARGDRRQLGADLTLGLRLIVLLGVPAAVGLIVLAEPLARLLFERGAFTPDDTARAVRMIRCYSLGVWAYCALPVLVRGFYAMGDRHTPVRIGICTVGLNLALNLTLIWPLAEAGLAVATATAAVVQVVALAVVFSRRKGPLHWRTIAATAFRTALATALMAAVAAAALAMIPAHHRLSYELARVLLPFLLGVGSFLAVYWLWDRKELRLLLAGHEEPAGDDRL